MDFKVIPTAELRRCPLNYKQVKKETVEYYQLRDSVRQSGILVPLLVRQENEVVDGMKRHEIAIDLRTEHVPCVMRQMTDDEVRLYQVQVDVNRIEPTTVELQARLMQIVRDRPHITLLELSALLRKHSDWIKLILKLDNLCTEARTIPLLKAAELAKLPKSAQYECLGLNVEDIQARARHYRQSIKDKRTHQELEPIFRNRSEVLREIETPTQMASVLCAEGVDLANPIQVGKAILKWVVRMDALSREQREK